MLVSLGLIKVWDYNLGFYSFGGKHDISMSSS